MSQNQVYIQVKKSIIDAFFAKEDFLKCPHKLTLYTKYRDDKKILLVCLYVDDLIYISNDRAILNDFKISKINEFDMTNLGLMHYFLSIEEL